MNRGQSAAPEPRRLDANRGQSAAPEPRRPGMNRRQSAAPEPRRPGANRGQSAAPEPQRRTSASLAPRFRIPHSELSPPFPARTNACAGAKTGRHFRRAGRQLAMLQFTPTRRRVSAESGAETERGMGIKKEPIAMTGLKKYPVSAVRPRFFTRLLGRAETCGCLLPSPGRSPEAQGGMTSAYRRGILLMKCG